MLYCPKHCIRIHAKTRTFVYYNGADRCSKAQAALRNIRFERDYFRDHILGNPSKAETHRICHETSEDAFTWNVFSRLAGAGLLSGLLSLLAGSSVNGEPELYLWGLKVQLQDPSKPQLFPALERAHCVFEKDIAKFRTEPDVMLYVPGELPMLVEAKLTSGNTVASGNVSGDVSGEKPKSREGILKRYNPKELPAGALLTPSSSGPFYGQLYRNLFFAIYMANELGVKWEVVNLVSKRRFGQQSKDVECQDPAQFIRALLPESSRNQFFVFTWEHLYADYVVKTTELRDLKDYMYDKSANGCRALAV